MTQRGFTLIEVLISLTLLSLIMGLLFSSLYISSNTWQKSETKLTQLNQIATCYQFVQRHLSTALPLTNERLKKTGDINAPLAFQGNQQSIQFVSATHLGLKLFTLKKQNDMLKINVRPFFFLTNNINTDQEDITLLTHVKAFNINYFGSTDANPASWKNEWLKNTIQPHVIKLSIQLNNGTRIPDWLIELKTPAQDFALLPITPVTHQ